MDPTLDIRSFSKRTHQCGNYLYLPPPAPDYAWAGAHESLMAHLEDLPQDIASELQGVPLVASRLMIDRFVRDAADANPHYAPEWIDALPIPYRTESYRSWGMWVVENPMIVAVFPYTGLGGYCVDLDSDGLIGAAYDLFNLARLGSIRQLAWLTVPVLPVERPEVLYPARYDHTRLVHVLDVAALATLLASMVELSSRDTATLVLAAVTHDARTPAGGDTTKLIDREFFDEDAHYASLLDQQEGIPRLLSRFDIPRSLLVETVQGQGILGRLLDIADKTAYLSRDAWMFHQRRLGKLMECPEGASIHDLLLRYPDNACIAWQSVRLMDGQVVFTDPEALARMLELRALLFRALYWHQASRFAEFIVGHVVLRHLIDTGEIQKEQLLRWRDDELDQHVQAYANMRHGFDFGEPCSEGFSDQLAAERRRAELYAEGDTVSMVEILPERVSSGTSFTVLVGSRIVSLKNGIPELARPIDALAQTVDRFRLYWVPVETMAPRLHEVMRTLFACR